MDPGTATLAGTLGAGALSLAGNLAGANMSNQASARVAAENRDFQERMSSTAYQRSVSDMKAAGLNPGLMYGSGGAESTPSGAVPMVAQMGDLGSSTVSSATQALGVAQQLAQLDSVISRTNADTSLAVENAAKVHTELDNASSARALMASQSRAADAAASAADLDRQLKAAIRGLIHGLSGDTPEGLGSRSGGWVRKLWDKLTPEGFGDDVNELFRTPDLQHNP